MERNKHRGPGGASCFIWQIEAPYPHGPVITQESRVNKEKSRPLLPLFLLSITFSHSPSIRYNPLLLSLCGAHCLLSFLPPLLFPPSGLSPPPSVPPRVFFKEVLIHSLAPKRPSACCIAAFSQPAWAEDTILLLV